MVKLHNIVKFTSKQLHNMVIFTTIVHLAKFKTITQHGEIQLPFHNMIKFTNSQNTIHIHNIVKFTTIVQHGDIRILLHNITKFINYILQKMVKWANNVEIHKQFQKCLICPYPQLLFLFESKQNSSFIFSWIIFGFQNDFFSIDVQI